MDLEGKIRRPRPEFDNERVRYEHRFAPLAQVSTPPLVPYVQFKEMTKVRPETAPKKNFKEVLQPLAELSAAQKEFSFSSTFPLKTLLVWNSFLFK